MAAFPVMSCCRFVAFSCWVREVSASTANMAATRPPLSSALRGGIGSDVGTVRTEPLVGGGKCGRAVVGGETHHVPRGGARDAP